MVIARVGDRDANHARQVAKRGEVRHIHGRQVDARRTLHPGADRQRIAIGQQRSERQQRCASLGVVHDRLRGHAACRRAGQCVISPIQHAARRRGAAGLHRLIERDRQERQRQRLDRFVRRVGTHHGGRVGGGHLVHLGCLAHQHAPVGRRDHHAAARAAHRQPNPAQGGGIDHRQLARRRIHPGSAGRAIIVRHEQQASQRGTGFAEGKAVDIAVEGQLCHRALAVVELHHLTPVGPRNGP